MALVDTGCDVWSTEYDSCERLYADIVKQLHERDAQPRGSDKFNTISASVRIHLSQFNIQLSQLDDRIKATTNITPEERERRLRLAENLQSKFVHLTKMYQTTREMVERRQLYGGVSWQDDDSDVPLLGDEPTVDQLKDHQRRVLQEQDRGLENLSSIIGRQKQIAITMSNEVESQNEVIDDIGRRMESVNAGIRGTTTNVIGVARSDSTWLYWLTIIILFFCIIGLAI